MQTRSFAPKMKEIFADTAWPTPTIPRFVNQGAAVQVEIFTNIGGDMSKALPEDLRDRLFNYTRTELGEMNAGQWSTVAI